MQQQGTPAAFCVPQIFRFQSVDAYTQPCIMLCPDTQLVRLTLILSLATRADQRGLSKSSHTRSETTMAPTTETTTATMNSTKVQNPRHKMHWGCLTSPALCSPLTLYCSVLQLAPLFLVGPSAKWTTWTLSHVRHCTLTLNSFRWWHAGIPLMRSGFYILVDTG